MAKEHPKPAAKAQGGSLEHTVRALSPSMLVAKRFFRNRLAIVGLVIVSAMFLFSFLGGLIIPYTQTQVFYTEGTMEKDYASATVNRNLYYTAAPEESFPSAAQAQFILAVNRKQDSFEYGGSRYSYVQEGQDFYRILGMERVAGGTGIRGIYVLEQEADHPLPAGAQDAFAKAAQAGEKSFTVDGQTFALLSSGRNFDILAARDIAVASRLIYNLNDSAASIGYDFRLSAQRAIEAGEAEFTAGETKFLIETGEDNPVIRTADGTLFALVSDLIVTPSAAGQFLPLDFKAQLSAAIADGENSFTYAGADGAETLYRIVRRDFQFDVKTETPTHLIDTYSSPNGAHPLGTDGFGMDLLTRLMYGGRVSLIIGFIVVFIEVLIGVVLGGISGYFGRWVDMIIMRVVDIINCIPSLPLYIILGSIMDALRVSPTLRIYYLMVILGLTGWAGIARMVRGQILSLREQEFMLATEATGLSVPRRIFRHLVPNVVPQLIVYATMGLGSIILLEATLSFLGLGVKYPYASWGNIVTAVNDSFVLTNYTFVWIPAGFLILLTVLGFNFVGDGLRDAFDPKMKR